MSTNVIMPSLGFDMTQGKLLRWLKKEGDAVQKDEPIAEIETEKAAVEIQAAVAGVLKKIMLQPGATVPVGTVMGIIADADEKIEAAPSPTATASASAKQTPTSTPTFAPTLEKENGRIKASPIARKMASEAGIDLATVKGSGPAGRIMERDVQSAIAQMKTAPATQLKPSAPPQPPTAPAPTAAGSLALSKMRQTIARRMTESKTTVPHFYLTIEINMTRALEVREQLNALASDAEKLSINDLIVAAAARTLAKFPNLNASYKGDALELHDHVNIGIAVAVDDGLLTPVLHDADKKSLKQIAAESKGLSERARANKMRPDDLGPGTFSVSNLGMFGIEEFAAIINPPEAAILAVGAVTKKPLVENDAVKIAPMLKVTLSVDHRVADGAQGARFLQEFKKLMENPVNLLM